MVQQNRQPGQLASDLFRDAMAAAYPDRFGTYTDDLDNYRVPLDRLSGYLDDQASDGDALGLIDWSPALKAAYRDGYDPLMRIGSGSSSSVWRCIDRSFGREVAIKFMRDDNGLDTGKAVQALQHEAELLGRLQHPGIVQAVRRSGSGSASYLAIDFVDGDDLLTHVRLLDLDAKSRIRLFARLLDAVSYLHEKEVVHGDLKPDHILVRENSQPVLIDFGLSSSDQAMSLDLSTARHIGGSGHYRATEIVSSTATAQDPRQDVYSLGVLLRELVEDVPLGETRLAVESVIRTATQENPDQRPADARELLRMLQPVLTTQPFDEPSNTYRVSTSRLWIYAAFAILFLGVAAFTLLWPATERPVADPGRQAQPERITAQASLLDLALQDIYSGNQHIALDRLATLNDGNDEAVATWEQRHIQSMANGRGELLPFGETPYEAANALSVDYDASSKTLSYVTFNEGQYELWLRSLNVSPRMVYASSDLIMDVALGKGAKRLAMIKESGECVAWLLDEQTLKATQQTTVPGQRSNRKAWFGTDGQSLYLLSPSERRLECWMISQDDLEGPAFVISDCDHAYRLESSGGALMVATKGTYTENGRSVLRIVNNQGETTRQIELEDNLLPTSADALPGPGAMVALGMPNGYVRIFKSEGGWQKPCDLGTNSTVTAIVISESEGRIFAALARVHVIDMEGKLLMRLGNRDENGQLITQLVYDEAESTLTSVSVQELWRCIGK